MTEKRQNLEQNSQYLWNILFSRRSVWVLLELVSRWTQTFKPKSTKRHVKLDKFVFGTPWLPDLLCKHWFASSVWNFRRWVADVPPRETSPAARSKEKRMFSQANSHCTVTFSAYNYLCGLWESMPPMILQSLILLILSRLVSFCFIFTYRVLSTWLGFGIL